MDRKWKKYNQPHPITWVELANIHLLSLVYVLFKWQYNYLWNKSKFLEFQQPLERSLVAFTGLGLFMTSSSLDYWFNFVIAMYLYNVNNCKHTSKCEIKLLHPNCYHSIIFRYAATRTTIIMIMINFSLKFCREW